LIARFSGLSGAYVDVLSIAKFSSAPDPAAYYLEVIANERDDYYLASGEAPGRWIGAGAGRLGLTGAVEADALRSVIEGVDPSSGDPLTRWRKIKGFDLTLSAPKSVSLLWGLGDVVWPPKSSRRTTRRWPRRFGIWKTRRVWSAGARLAPPVIGAAGWYPPRSGIGRAGRRTRTCTRTW
jgi:hypothetical protein